MDQFLALVGVQAMKYAIKSGIALTSNYALKQCSTLLKSVENRGIQKEMQELQRSLEDKIRIITPAIDLIELKSGRGNNVLESAVALTKSINRDIFRLGRQIESAMARRSPAANADSHDSAEAIISQMKSLLKRIDDNIPLLQLVISASGESLSTSLPSSISPSRMLQASTFLTIGDTHFAANPTKRAKIGPEYLLSVYMLFLAHFPSGDDPSSPIKKPTWEEVVHKARVQLYRVPSILDTSPSHYTQKICENVEFNYTLEITEDLDDGRVHDILATHHNTPLESTIAESVPIREIAKTFYVNSGKILNLNEEIEGANNPVLLLKRDMNDCQERGGGSGCSAHQDEEQSVIDLQLAEESFSQHCRFTPPNSTNTQPISCDSRSFPSSVDPRWIAFEMFEHCIADESDTSSESGESEPSMRSIEQENGTSVPDPFQDSFTDHIGSISIDTETQQASSHSLQCHSKKHPQLQSSHAAGSLVARSPFHAVTTSLSLLEMTIRLAGLQEFQQTSHLSIPDHILTFFLEESSTTGFSGERKWAAATEATSRVGFDPYSDTVNRE